MPAYDAEALRRSLRGVVVPVVTPFATDGSLDLGALDRQVGWLVDQGVHGILVADLVGEAWALAAEEKAALFARAVRVVAGRVPTIAKLSETALASQQALAAAARAAGADGVKVVLPSWPAADDEQAYAYLSAAVAPAGLPFMVETNATDVSFVVLDRLAADPQFVGLEDASRDLDHFARLVERYGDRAPVFGGSEDVLAFHLLLGGAGFMTAAPNFAPRFMLALWQAAAAGRMDEVLGQFARLRRYRRLLGADLAAGRPAFASYAKAALELLGRPAGPPRVPLRRLTAAERGAFAAVLFDADGFGLPRP